MAPSVNNHLESKRRNFFLLSTGRTATTFLASALNQYPGIEALHEPKPSRILRMWSMAQLEHKVSDRYMASALYNKRRKLYANSTKSIYVESNPFLIGFTGVLSIVFNKPYIIHVVRDPRTFVSSSLNHGNGKGLKLFFNSYVPYWYPKVEEILKLSSTRMPMKYRAAAYWSLANQRLSEYGKQHPDNYALFRFEDLFGEDPSYMNQFLKLFGPDISSNPLASAPAESINKSRHTISQPWQKWSDEDCKTINEICQPLMSEFGYGSEQTWVERTTDTGGS